ncbi:class F sortase [Streptomyces sp. NP-1717]|uniref:class F sortase n=1 Tax=unclassified Streptomyces TaxID=2593676 RepID=UPI001F5C518B|nr:class F sortase [Streptomyces sp. NP-1717]MCI3226443.1 class F sortase [Streptomyces sp. NP-1717]WTA77270.1 class F sortase [Streptomyces sp. NBC_00838]
MGLAHRGSESRKRSPWGVLALVMLSGLALMRNGADVSLGPPQPASAAGLDTRTEQVTEPATVPIVKPLPYAPMSRVTIPAIKVDAPVMDVGLDPEGWIAAPPPQDANMAGWYQNGVAPGQRGTAVVVGHVDNQAGPAVFYGLGSLSKGEHIEVTRFDERVAVFEIYGVEVFSKNDFPGARVYGDTGHSELRVITCGGGYSKAGGYDGNVVVFARLVETR